jgi:hypothetical protein
MRGEGFPLRPAIPAFTALSPSDGDRGEGNADETKAVEAEGGADPMPELVRTVADKPATAAGGTVVCIIAG